MAKHWFKYISGLVLLLVVAAWALAAGAGRASAATEPTPAPPPVIGENPAPSTGNAAEGEAEGGVVPEIPENLPEVAPPNYTPLKPQEAEQIVWATEVEVPLRRQNGDDPTDVSCGVQAAGMVMDALSGGQGPSSETLLARLQEEGLMYAWGDRG